ncbi:MAG: lipid IV(A) 3-deoxy-D-manno-octulosonic acid transferase [Burkholderiales bacterium]|jgi:3-deoxy-D-manno-octulosonic-acid transferase|nr:lipid IV(A) 3-deoxy-D-manno-octulosonic acid transferase [Burkholderiales bacterium]
MIWRGLYTLLGFLLMPALALRLYWRGRKNPLYRQHIGERFGHYRTPPLADTIWIHAVSVGETRAAAPLIAQLQKRYPQTSIVLTHMTATGRATGASLFGDTVTQVWLPYDYRFAVRRFLNHYSPRLALLMETEVWPNVIGECRRRGVPCFLVNARMSECSAKKYALFSSLMQPVFAALRGVAVQTESDAKRLAALGARNVAVIGNLKFDILIPPEMDALGKDFRKHLLGGDDVGDKNKAARPIWTIASTRDGEETLILDALCRARHKLPDNIVIVIVPRHPERFDVVADLLTKRHLAFIRRSDHIAVPDETTFVVGDSMGELFAYYAAADVAFVGGSLLPLGGQNLLEPISVGTPTLIGRHTYNFQDISVAACRDGAALRVADADALIEQVGELLTNLEKREAMRTASRRFLSEHRGATERLVTWIEETLR